MILKNIKDFSLYETLECGQCFHFEKLAKDEYVVIANQKLLHVEQKGEELIFHNASEEDVINIWIPYFDLLRDYKKIKKSLIKMDKILKEPINKMPGIRIMNQDFYEMLISFIISQNKQIPQIKKIIFAISEKYGKNLGNINGKDYYSFPDLHTLKTITEEDFRDLKTGFRAPYLRDAVIKMQDYNPEKLKNMDFYEAQSELMKIKGVGEKVANCVLLFALGFRSSFPIDVWIQRIMQDLYYNGEKVDKKIIKEFAKERFMELGGYAQQYLFVYGRDKK